MKELPNCKIGVTSSTHQRLRELKLKGDNFNDVIVRLLPEAEIQDKFDAVAEAYKLLDKGELYGT